MNQAELLANVMHDLTKRNFNSAVTRSVFLEVEFPANPKVGRILFLMKRLDEEVKDMPTYRNILKQMLSLTEEVLQSRPELNLQNRG